MFINNNYNQIYGYKQSPLKPAFKSAQSQLAEALDTFIRQETKLPAQRENLIEQFKKIITENVLKKSGKINNGERGTVYKADESLVYKVLKDETPVIDNLKINNNEISKDLKTYYGDTIAELGNVKVLKNAVGNSKGIPAGVSGEAASYAEMLKQYNEVYLPTFAKLPQKAFDDIALDFNSLNNVTKDGSYFKFDTINPNNFIAVDDSIKIVDELEKTTERDPNTLAKMINVFVNSFTHDTKASFDLLGVGNRKVLLKKCILAGEKAELPYGRSMQERGFLNDAMELCNFQETFSELQRTLMDYRRRYPDMQERLKNVSKYLDEFENEDLMYNTSHFYD